VKGWHSTEFGIVFLGLRFMLGPKRNAWAFSIAALLAASDEYHQTFIPQRGGHVGDCLIDVIGAACMWIFVTVREREFKGKPYAYLAIPCVALPAIRYLALHTFL
jgi:VanZ family protein